jgi:hypothetical protein
MDLSEYTAMKGRAVADWKARPDKYHTPDDVCRHMLLGVAEFDEVNREWVREAVEYFSTLRTHRGFTYVTMQAAMKRRKKEIEDGERKQTEAEAQQARLEQAIKAFGGTPKNARDATWMYVNHNGVAVRYDGTCYQQGKVILPSVIEGSIILTAEANAYTFGDGKIMSNAGIKLAWVEFMEMARDARKDVVWDFIESTDHAAAAKALSQLRALCGKLFIEPEFADAAIRKWIWQVKRRMAGLYIREKHFLVFRGGQGTGKTELAREIIRPISEVAVEASIEQVVDERNFLTRSMFVAFTDELARAERTDLNQVKGVVTGETSTSRVLYSHHSQRNPVNLSLIGTADKPVCEMLSDPAGMRRFVEVMTKPLHQMHLDWQEEVVALPWADIWRAVDYTTDDPLTTQFGDLLREKQEAMRRRPNVEAWLEAFEFDPKLPMPTKKDYVPGEYVEYGAKDLYLGSFRLYEEKFHPGSKETSLTTWGLKLKEMIDSEKLPRWRYRRTGNHVVYRYAISDAEAQTGASQGLVLLRPSKQQGKHTAAR